MPEMIRDGVLTWTDDLDERTLEQAEKSASLPFIYKHVALMPDAHLGYGATVGSVIPTQGAIIPSAVGVDIGCLDATTEFLSPVGWVRMDEWNGHRVMQYDPETGSGYFVGPSAYIAKPAPDGFIAFETKYGIDQMVSPDHRVLLWRVMGRDRRQVQEVMLAEDLATEHESLVLGANVQFETSFTPETHTEVGLTEAQWRVQVMVLADAHLTESGTAVVKVRKDRKVRRAWDLLEAAGVEFTHRVSEQTGDHTFRFTPPVETKTYDQFWGASLKEMEVIVDEVFHWDGNEQDAVFFTRDRASADFIQYAMTATGHRAVLRQDGLDYRVFMHAETRVGLKSTKPAVMRRVPSEDGQQYCFTVPSGFFVARRNGKVFMTGNCGMIAVDTTLDASDLPETLDPLLAKIEERVPAGVGQGHEHEAAGERYLAMDSSAHDYFPEEVGVGASEERRAIRQFGSLGSGNHFIEVCLDERDHVWVVLHSGSRGIGNKLASKHIEGAKGLMERYFITLDEPDLAYFVEGTEEFEAYVRDLQWAQRYAFANRSRMMDIVMGALAEEVGVLQGADITRDRINCHHNYADREHHMGQNIWVTRKGAIRAREGDRGVIPGSMGAASFIVRGLGHPASFHSASHGAGRRMSRTQARQEFDVETLSEQMQGRAWLSGKAKALLDESPGAYKDIYGVMENQSDLVAIEHELRQILNFKGA